MNETGRMRVIVTDKVAKQDRPGFGGKSYGSFSGPFSVKARSALCPLACDQWTAQDGIDQTAPAMAERR